MSLSIPIIIHLRIAFLGLFDVEAFSTPHLHSKYFSFNFQFHSPRQIFAIYYQHICIFQRNCGASRIYWLNISTFSNFLVPIIIFSILGNCGQQFIKFQIEKSYFTDILLKQISTNTGKNINWFMGTVSYFMLNKHTSSNVLIRWFCWNG